MKRLFKSPLGRTILSVGLLSAALPMIAAGADDECRTGRGRGNDRDHGHGVSWQIVFGDPYRRSPRYDDFPRSRHREPRDEMPCELEFQAFQAGDQVILIAKGENHSRGFTTCLRACDLDDRRPEIVLVNTPPRDRCDTDGRECFEVKGSFRAHCEVREIEVKIAGECKRVSVCQIARIG